MDANCKILNLVQNYLSKKMYGLGGNDVKITDIQKYFINKLNCKTVRMNLDCLKQFTSDCNNMSIDLSCPNLDYDIQVPFNITLQENTPEDFKYFKITLQPYLSTLEIDYNNPDSFKKFIVPNEYKWDINTEEDVILDSLLNKSNHKFKVYEYLLEYGLNNFSGEEESDSDSQSICTYVESTNNLISFYTKKCNNNTLFNLGTTKKTNINCFGLNNIHGIYIETEEITPRLHHLKIHGLRDYYTTNLYSFNTDNIFFSWRISLNNNVYPAVFENIVKSISHEENPFIILNPNYIANSGIKINLSIIDLENNLVFRIGDTLEYEGTVSYLSLFYQNLIL